ncbi:MAG: hypothetical protein WD069_14780 [Planctomycetales bacterium]
MASSDFHRDSTLARVALRVTVALAATLAVSRPSIAADDSRIEPALGPDPAVTKLIDGLGAKSSVELPPIRTVGEWNAVTKEYGMERTGPQGRDYTIKAVWMPDRRRAFFCGANHGSPHRLNDAWEYDLPANTWVMLFAPDPNNARGVMEVVEKEIPPFDPPQKKEGEKPPPGGTGPQPAKKVLIVQTKRGGPTHYGHTWWGLAYDPKMKAALWMNAAIGESPQAYVAQQKLPGEVYGGPPLWAFDPAQKKWDHVLTHEPRPKSGVGAMEYVPELGGVFWYQANWFAEGMWVYHPSQNAWKNLEPNGGENLYFHKETPKASAVMAYDRDRKTVVAILGRTTHHYDVAKNAWSLVLDESDQVEATFNARESVTPFHYDPIGKVCLLYSPTTPDSVWSYSAGEKKWTRNRVAGAAGPRGGKFIAYFDEARNALVVNTGANTWLYRHEPQRVSPTGAPRDRGE